MRKAERTAAAMLILALALIGACIALTTAPQARILRLDIQAPPSVARLFLPVIGDPYLSHRQIKARRLASELEYVRKVRVWFSDNACSVRTEHIPGGVILMSASGAQIEYPDRSISVHPDDVPYLMRSYPVIEVDGIPSEIPSDLEKCIGIARSLYSDDGNLITWMKYCNIGSEGSMLVLALPSLKAELCVMEPVSADRIRDSIQRIKNERTGLILSDEVFRLYEDRLVRVRH